MQTSSRTPGYPSSLLDYRQDASNHVYAAPRRGKPIAVLLAIAVGALLALVSCGSDDPTPTDDAGGAPTGIVAVRIEPVEGIFVEGFEVGLRFETADGTTIAAALWSDFVNTQDSPEIDDYYTSVLEQVVPAGDVVVLASANIGIGPPPEVPNVNGDLRCRLDVTVPPDGRVDVEVGFGDPNNCLSTTS